MADLKIEEVETVAGWAHLAIRGEIDLDTVKTLKERLNQLIDGGASKVLVNFADVDFVSSAGLRILLATAKKLSGSGGNLRISNLNETVSEVFEISGFSTILDVFGSEEEALRGF